MPGGAGDRAFERNVTGRRTRVAPVDEPAITGMPEGFTPAVAFDACFDALTPSTPTWAHTLPPGTEIPWESRLIRRSGL